MEEDIDIPAAVGIDAVSVGGSASSDSDYDSGDLLSASDSDDYDSSDSDEYLEESLGKTIIREIQEGVYTCLICTSEIDLTSKVWSCRSCYRVYDLPCIKDWAIRGSSTDKESKSWRCPACNVATNKIPKKFTCWCGSVSSPAPNQESPFSCGGPCKHKYSNCIHSCSSECHPGAHPICGALGPLMKCHCGKHENQLPCLVTPYESGWSCEEPCNIEICDLNHQCSKGCHDGFCGPCDSDVHLSCYCGKADLSLSCNDKLLKSCTDLDSTKSWIGGGVCDAITKVFYECGIHFDDLSCQPLPSGKKICAKSPSIIKSCFCGSQAIDPDLRKVCTDPIPTCTNRCNKPLPCGCFCLLKCHEGECVCFNFKEVPCGCGHEMFTVPCKFLRDGNLPKCKHKCEALMNCRRHYHREQCCSFERQALEREREKKKAIRNNTRSNFRDEIMTIEPVHICMQTCNRLKGCGIHHCEGLCHNGPCGVCLESSSEDLVCNCGKTVLEAPVRCGLKIHCNEQCIREKPCGHSPEPHRCHDDDVPCPKCTTFVSKACNCGLRSDIPGILCSQESVNCGDMCRVPKTCGHLCLRTCSKQCIKENIHLSATLCQDVCNKRRENCPHRCKMKCHASKVGRSPKCDAITCKESVILNCECGRIARTVSCGTGLEQESAIGTIIECDKDCAKLKRDIELKRAFNLYGEEQKESLELLVSYSSYVMTTFSKQKKWCSSVELFLRKFITDYKSGAENAKRAHSFPAMVAPQSRFIKELAESYNLYVEAEANDPSKSLYVVITVQTAVPELGIEESISIKQEFDAKNEAVRLKNESAKFNALIVQDVFFGKLHDFIESQLRYAGEIELETTDTVFDWIKESTCLFYYKSTYMNDLDDVPLYQLMLKFRKVVRERSLAFDVKLCYIDEDHNIIKRGDKPVPREVVEDELSIEGENADPIDIEGNEELAATRSDIISETSNELELDKNVDDPSETVSEIMNGSAKENELIEKLDSLSVNNGEIGGIEGDLSNGGLETKINGI